MTINESPSSNCDLLRKCEFEKKKGKKKGGHVLLSRSFLDHILPGMLVSGSDNRKKKCFTCYC